MIASIAGVYGGLYVWDRFRWNAHAKEQQLKDQFRYNICELTENLKEYLISNVFFSDIILRQRCDTWRVHIRHIANVKRLSMCHLSFMFEVMNVCLSEINELQDDLKKSATIMHLEIKKSVEEMHKKVDDLASIDKVFESKKDIACRLRKDVDAFDRDYLQFKSP